MTCHQKGALIALYEHRGAQVRLQARAQYTDSYSAV